VGTGLPAVARRFVAADVDILRGEESDHLGKDVFEEFERALLARTEDVVRAADPTRYFVGFVENYVLFLHKFEFLRDLFFVKFF
jgi:hypothetical protein